MSRYKLRTGKAGLVGAPLDGIFATFARFVRFVLRDFRFRPEQSIK